VLQEPQLGTGHAVMQAVPHLDDRWPTLVLYGDVPLIRAATLKHLIEEAGKAWACSRDARQSAGYGRICARGKSRGIVEDKDASARQRALREINTGIVVARRRSSSPGSPSFRATTLKKSITHRHRRARDKERVPVTAIQADAAWETLG